MKEEVNSSMTKKSSHFFKNNWVYFLLSFIIFVLPILLYIGLYQIYYGMNEMVVIELGESVTQEDFFHKAIPKDTVFLTDLNSLDLTKVGEYTIEIEVFKQKKTSILKIEDTTPPEVEVEELYRYTDYKIDPNDFIVSKKDLSSMTVSLENEVNISSFGDYPVKLVVSDASGNLTRLETTLHIGVIKTYYELELGDTFEKENLLYNEKDEIEVPEEEIQSVNSGVLGDYTLHVIYNGETYTSRVKVQDTTPPKVEVQNKNIYENVTSVTKDDIIVSATDASGEVTTTMEGEIKYGVLGDYEITITGVDKNGLQTVVKAVVSVVKDTTPPVISGLGNITVNKYTQINYLSGVQAVDDKDGNVSVSVNSSKVNVNTAGTYYATYTATDSSGNTATASRTITVRHDQSDLNNLVRQHANRVGNSVPEVNEYVKHLIGYSSSWGDNDPVWYGLTNYRGNCYVHALVLQAILQAKGYEVLIIHTNDNVGGRPSHYWDLVNLGNGKWCHSDATPGNLQEGIICSNDTERINMLQGRDWDHSQWPAAE